MIKTVMVVDDYDDSREFLKILVQGHGFKVIEAVNGLEAVEKSVECHPSLIFMDFVMPIMDGVTATDLIRAIEGFEDIPIVGLTGLDNNSYGKAATEKFNDILTKPLNFERLEPLLHHYLD